MKVALLVTAVLADSQEAISLVRASAWQTATTIFSSNGYDTTASGGSAYQWGYEVISSTATADKTQPFLKWSIENRSFYNYDTGEQWIALRHILETPIFYDDVITFGIGFLYTKNDGTQSTQVSGGIYADVATCTVQVNTKNGVFWDQSVEDGYILDDGTDGTTWTGAKTYTVDSQQDWIVYIEDEDKNKKFCDWDSSYYKSWFGDAKERKNTPYQCTRIYCTMARKFTTDDSVNDFDFEAPDNANQGTLDILGYGDATKNEVGITYLLIDQDNVVEAEELYAAKIFPQEVGQISLVVDAQAYVGIVAGLACSLLISLNF